MTDTVSEPQVERTSAEQPPRSRRQFLRGSTIVAVVGSLGGCLDDPTAIPDPGDELVDDGRDGEPPQRADDGDDPGTDEDDPGIDGDDPETDVDERVTAHEQAIHEQVNETRQDHDRERLAYNDDIAAVARGHSADMAEREYFAHESPEGEGPHDRMADFFPGRCRMVGENIAKVGLRPDDDPAAVGERVVSGWMRSPGHRENLLRETFHEEGIGVTITDDDRVLATQKFCGTDGS